MPVYNQYFADQHNKINTPESVARLIVAGPTVPVAISPTQTHLQVLFARGQPAPQPIVGVALVDTGATLCAVDEASLRNLGIPPYGYATIVGASGPRRCLTYPASLGFPGTTLPNLTFQDFHGLPLASLGVVAVIGRNVLAHFVMVYNGPGGHVSFSY